MLLSALVFGLLSSLHCLGMCGPIALMLPLNRKNQATKILGLLVYHFGRITSYVTIGMVFGILGRFFRLGGFQQYVSVAAGIIIILIALVPEAKLYRLKWAAPLTSVIGKVKGGMAKRFSKQSIGALFSIGVLNGFLPCGLVYAAVFGALAANSTLESLLFMVFFGLGTIPLVSSLNLLGDFLTVNIRSKLLKAVPVIMCVMGVLFIARGMGLGIPYVSPSNMNLMVKSEAHCK